MSAPAMRHAATFRVPSDHPSLPGHFPGQPVVPGVVLLEEVLKATEAWLAKPVSVEALPQAKFLAPLLPDEPARIDLELEGCELRFRIERAAEPIARGAFVLSRGQAP